MGNRDFKEDRRRHLSGAIQNGIPVHMANTRYTGYSTGLALRIIGQAMMSPGNGVLIEDTNITQAATDNLKYTILRTIESLDLVGFAIKGNKLTYSLEYISKEQANENR